MRSSTGTCGVLPLFCRLLVFRYSSADDAQDVSRAPSHVSVSVAVSDNVAESGALELPELVIFGFLGLVSEAHVVV